MTGMMNRAGIALGALAGLAFLGSGCEKAPPHHAVRAKQAKEHTHEGWWCDEHGIPEEECSMCSKKVADEFKKKGDWCEQHDRAKSQCFVCDPSLKEKFAARYREKNGGKEPPPIKEEKKSGG